MKIILRYLITSLAIFTFILPAAAKEDDKTKKAATDTIPPRKTYIPKGHDPKTCGCLFCTHSGSDRVESDTGKDGEASAKGVPKNPGTIHDPRKNEASKQSGGDPTFCVHLRKLTEKCDNCGRVIHDNGAKGVPKNPGTIHDPRKNEASKQSGGESTVCPHGGPPASCPECPKPQVTEEGKAKNAKEVSGKEAPSGKAKPDN